MARGRAASTAAARLARIAAGETTSGVMATSSSSSSSSSSSAAAAASRALARLFGSRASSLASSYGALREKEALSSCEEVVKEATRRETASCGSNVASSSNNALTIDTTR